MRDLLEVRPWNFETWNDFRVYLTLGFTKVQMILYLYLMEKRLVLFVVMCTLECCAISRQSLCQLLINARQARTIYQLSDI